MELRLWSQAARSILPFVPPGVAARVIDLIKLPVPLSSADIRKYLQADRELMRLPTVQQGMKALGMRSLTEWHLWQNRIVNQESPYTHPLLRPYRFLPGFETRMFYDRAEFPWVPELEAAFEEIRAELIRVLEEPGEVGFQPWRSIEDGKWMRSDGTRGTADDGESDWNMLHLFQFGDRVERNCARCPRTIEALAAIPRLSRKALVCFSALNPGMHIGAHFGPTNAALRVHFPLIVPPGCTIRVGDQTREWKEGEVLIFSDAYEHEVWHRGDSTRFVLFFDIWDPGWTDEEIPRIEDLVFPRDTDFIRTYRQWREKDGTALANRKWWRSA